MKADDRKANGWHWRLAASVALVCLLLSSRPLCAQEVAARQQAQPLYVPLNLSFDQIDLAQLQQRLAGWGLEIPLELTGTVSTNIRGQLPLGALVDPEAYRFAGTLTSEQITVSGIELRDVSAAAIYEDGVLVLEQLRFAVPPEQRGGPSGAFAGQASLQLVPRGDLIMELALTEIPISQFMQLVPEISQLASGTISGTMQATAPVDRAAEIAAWTATAELAVSGLIVADLPAAEVDANFVISEALLTVTQLMGEADGTQLDGSARLQLEPPYNFGARIELIVTQLAILEQLRPELQPPLELQGSVQLASNFQGALSPPSVEATGTGAAAPLLIGGVQLDSVRFSYSATPRQLQLTRLSATAYGGSARGTVSIPLENSSSGFLELAWQEVVLGELWEDVSTQPVEFAARARGELLVQIPPGRIQEPTDWHGSLDLLLDDVRWREAAADEMALWADLEQDAAIRAEAIATLYDGQAAAQAQWSLLEHQPASVQVVWRELELGGLLEDLELLPFPLNGESTGRGELEIPAGQLDQPHTWTGQSTLLVDSAGLGQLRADDVLAQLIVEQQQLRIVDLNGQLAEGALRLSGQLGLHAPYEYQMDMRLESADLEAVNTLPTQLRPPITLAGYGSLTGQLQGSLDPFAVRGSGELAAESLLLDETLVNDLALEYQIDERQLLLRDLEMTLHGGTMTGSLTLPLEPAVPGAAELKWQQIDLGSLASDVWPLNVPLIVEANSRGRISASAEGGQSHDWRRWQAQLTIDIPQLTTNGVPAGSVEAEAEYQEQMLEYEASGHVLEGALQLAGRTALADEAELAAMRFSLEGLQLARLGVIFPQSEPLKGLSGTLAAAMTYPVEGEEGAGAGAAGQLALSNLSVGQIRLSDRLQGRLLAVEKRIYLDDFAGSYAGGRLRASAMLDMNQMERSQFALSLAGAELSEALAAWPGVASFFSGVGDLQLRGTLAQPMSARGLLALREGVIGPLTLNDVRLPLELIIDPLRGQVRVVASQSAAQLARGRVTGTWEIGWRRGLYVDGRWRFSNVEVESLLRQFTRERGYGTGRITGQLELSGRRVSSVNDLRGSLVAQLRETQAMSFPVLQQLQPYVARGVTGSTRFGNGQLEARLSRGVIRLEELSLASDVAQLFLSGTITTAGRLNLEATAATGQVGDAQFVAQALLNRFAQVGPTPVAALAAANEFLSNRVIHMQISGTLRSPTVRVRPLPILGQEAVRFFLRQAVAR